MSIKLVLSHYLAGLRERNELDALLPELLLAMGHSVLSRPQQGVNQAGVDVVSTFQGGDGKKVVYLFVIKFGDVVREGFFGGKQTVDSSIREASNTFIRNRLPQGLQECEKRIVLVSNGFLRQEIQDGFAAVSKEIAERQLQSLHFWGSDQLTPLIEKHIFNESLVLDKGKSDLRASLATLEETEASVHRFIRFIDSCMEAPEKETSERVGTRKKNFLRRCAAAAMGWAVLLVWCETERNLKPGVIAGEYVLLRLWADAVRAGWQRDKKFQERLLNLLGIQLDALLRYYQKLAKHLVHKREVLGYRPEHVFYTDVIFEELGRLGLTLLLLQHVEGTEIHRHDVRDLLVRVINEHGCCHLPTMDAQSIDMSLAMLSLIGESDLESAQAVLNAAVHRLWVAVTNDRWLPIDSDSDEDAIASQEGEDVDAREHFRTSTLFPMLGTFAGVLNDREALGALINKVAPKMAEVTAERWTPSAELETLAGSQQTIVEVGVSKAIQLQEAPEDEVRQSLHTPPGAAAREDFKWTGTPFELLAAISARFHRHPLPAWYIVSHAERSRPSTHADMTRPARRPPSGRARRASR